MDEDDGDEGDKFPRAGLKNLHPVRGSTAFFALLAGFEEWFKIPDGSLPYIRRVLSCIIFSLEQSRVVDLTAAENHPGSISESNVLSDEFANLWSQCIHDFPKQFCQIA